MEHIFRESACSTLRTRLENLYEPRSSDTPDHKRFYPRTRIKALLSTETISELLRCTCSRCFKFRNVIGEKGPERYASKIAGKPGEDASNAPTNTSILVLAILLYIDCPALVFGFLRRKCYDRNLEFDIEKFDTDYISKIIWPKLLAAEPGLATNLADKFRWNKYKFVIPTIRDDGFSVYSKHTILPFINDKKIGRKNDDGQIVSEGGYGTVYACEILEEYRALQDAPEVTKFARKEIRDNIDSRLFKAERENLAYIKTIQDPHLVQIIKAYEHGGLGSIIFPLAQTNLGVYLRDPLFKAEQLSLNGIEMHPFWEQMLGVVRALHKILDYEAPDATRSHILYGYHLDLKPANILIKESGRFVISDFGQAHFRKAAGATSSKIVGYGGTESYAPPEIEDPSNVSNRKYDIWSLGCIFVEISTFVVKGYHGMNQFDEIRGTSSGNSRMTDDRFFRRLKPGQFELKPEIHQWIQNIPETIRQERSKDFMKEILSLTLGMLCVDVSLRTSSSDICLRLSEILSKRRSQDTISIASTSPLLELSSQETEVGKTAMARAKDIQFNIRGYWTTGSIRFIQHDQQLSLLTFESHNWEKRIMGDMSRLRLVPRYALREDLQPGLHRYSYATQYIYLPLRPTSGKYLDERFSASSMEDNRCLQEALLGQHVVCSFELQGALAVPFIDLARKVQRKLAHLSRPDEIGQFSEKAKTLQLWSENWIDENIESSREPMSTPRFLRSGLIPRRRIVIFFTTRILVIRMAKNFRLVHSKDNLESPHSVLFAPTDRYVDPRFDGLMIKKGEGETAPSIPLSKMQLEWEEDNQNEDFSSLRVDFISTSDATEFRSQYNRLKYQLKKDQAEFDKIKHKVGPTVGYARNDQ